jgi:hypothetical protein
MIFHENTFVLFEREETEYSFYFLFLIFFWNSPSIHENFQLVIYVSAHKHAFALDRQILPMN